MKKILKYSAVLISGIILGQILLCLTYLLPTNIMFNNLKKSAHIIEHERNTELIAASNIDNFTDSIMMANAIYNGNESFLEKSVKVYRKTLGSDEQYDPQKTLQVLLDNNNENEKLNTAEYSRYWHGYLIILKPLLLFVSYNGIRTLNTILLPLMVFIVCTLLYKNNKNNYILPYIISIILINPAAIMMSMQFSTMFYTYNIAMAFILYNKMNHKNYDILLFFLVVGMMTSYFDLSTCPLITLGMPVITLFILDDKIEWTDKIKDIFKFSVFWGIGYTGMWSGKWCVGSILVQENLISSALSAVRIRTSGSVANGSETLSIIQPVIENFKGLLSSKVYIPFIIAVLVYYIIKILKEKVRFDMKSVKIIIPFSLVCVMPFVWYMMVRNHSFIHFWFTYRSLAITIFGGLSMIENYISIVHNINADTMSD